RVLGQRSETRAFTGGIRDDLVLLQHEREVDDAHGDEHQERKRQRQLDNRVSSVRSAPNFHAWSHIVTISPTNIGTAYASRGPVRSASVIPGTGFRPITDKWVTINQRLMRAVFRYPRASATASARIPPAIVVNMATYATSVGPSHAPSAARSLTSPAPMPR